MLDCVVFGLRREVAVGDGEAVVLGLRRGGLGFSRVVLCLIRANLILKRFIFD